MILSQFQFIQIPGEYYVYPAQLPPDTCETIPWVPPETLIYNSDELFPGEFIKIVGEGIMDGARIVTVEVCPLQYRPKTKRIFLVRGIGIEFAFVPNTLPELRPHIRGKYEQPIYDAALAKVVANDYEIPAYYQKPTLVDEEVLRASDFGPGVIITPDWFKPYFQPYADWLTDQGLRTVIISPDWIYQNFSGRDNAEEIRNYIQYCYKEWGGTYFILGGDDDYLPVRYATSGNREPGEYIDIADSIPCDMYFSDLTGFWDVDGDNVWGELTQDQADQFPEAYVGRITAYNTNEVTNWVTKALNYEISPGFQPNNLITVSWVYNQEVGKGFAWQHLPAHIIQRNCVDQYAYPTAFNELNTGYGLVTVDCHGNIRHFASKLTDPRSHIWNYHVQPNGNDAGLNELANENMYHICYSMSCWCGAYDCLARTNHQASDTCVADGFVDAYANKGACAYLGNTRIGKLFYENVGPIHTLQANFYDNIFAIHSNPLNDNPLSRLGVAEALSKNLPDELWFDPFWDGWYRYACYSHNLFGSPHTEVWTNIPRDFIVSHPVLIPAGRESRFRVQVKDATTNDPVPYAKVCLNKPGDIFQVGQTEANGRVTFYITPQTAGILKVTVTRAHNLSTEYVQYLPSRTTCEVVEQPGGGQSSSSEGLAPTSVCIMRLPTFVKEGISIAYGIPKEGDALLSVYNITGSVVKAIRQEHLQPGYYTEIIDTKGFSSGIYFVMLKQHDEKVTKKFLLVR